MPSVSPQSVRAVISRRTSALKKEDGSSESDSLLMSSLANTLCRWYWTVRGLMNSRAPISGFESPSRASRAICASCAVSSSRGLDAALARRLAGGQQLARGAVGERLRAHRGEQLVGGAQLRRGRRAARRSRRSHSP